MKSKEGHGYRRHFHKSLCVGNCLIGVAGQCPIYSYTNLFARIEKLTVLNKGNRLRLFA
jgi:hypothetical protein